MPFGAPEILLMILALGVLFGVWRLQRIVRSSGNEKRKLKEDGFKDSGFETVDAPLVIGTSTGRSVTSSLTDEELLTEMQRRAASRS